MNASSAGVRAALAASVVLAVCSVGGSALADGQRVGLARPAVPDPTIAEAIHRIRGELQAEGFEVVDVDAPADGSPAPTAAPAARKPGAPAAGSGNEAPIATIELTLDEDAHAVVLQIVDRLTNKVVTRRDPLEPGATDHAAEVLAVRAVELLRASLLELLVEPRKASPPPTTDAGRASRWAARALPAEREPAWGVELGAIVLGDFGGVPPAVLALTRVRRVIALPIQLRLTLAGLGTEPRVDEKGVGSAGVTQAFGLVEVVATLGARWPVHPVVGVGAGAWYAMVDGRAAFPYQALSDHQWGAAFDAVLGAEVPFGKHVSISLEGTALALTPYPSVTFLGGEVAHTGTPSLGGVLSVVGWL